MPPSRFSGFSSLFPPLPTPFTIQYNNTIPDDDDHYHHVLNYPVITTVLEPSFTISSQALPNQLPTQQLFSSQENLISPSSSASQLHFPTATIPSQDFNVFTTDSQPSWLPSSSSSQPAPAPQQHHQHPQHPADHPAAPHQDFVLFDPSPSVRRTPSLFTQQALLANIVVTHLINTLPSALQNQRVAAIIQSAGHSISTSALTNRFHPAQQQFYASLCTPLHHCIAPTTQETRPQVLLFSLSNGNIPQTPNMAMEGNFHAYSPANSHDSHKTADIVIFLTISLPSRVEPRLKTRTHRLTLPSGRPSMYDPNMNLSSASSSTHMGTVSPQDLFVRDPFEPPQTQLLSPT